VTNLQQDELGPPVEECGAHVLAGSGLNGDGIRLLALWGGDHVAGYTFRPANLGQNPVTCGDKRIWPW